MEITKRLIEYALDTKFEDIPRSVIDVQKQSLVDAIGVMQAASTQSESCAAFLRYAREHGDSPRCTVISTGIKAAPETAALANGSLSHALDYEDTSSKATLHSNAVSTPALLALAEVKGNVSGKELLAALAIASDITCRLALACREDISKYGWYMPPVYGSMATVLAGCRLMGLSHAQTLDAIAHNLFQATGCSQLINSKKSTMRAVRDGFGARSAVTSVLMASYSTGAGFEEPFEGNKGFYAAYAKNDCDLSVILDGLGEVYHGEELVIKFWPTCLGTHTGIQSIMEVMEENDLAFDDILSIHMKVSEFAKNVLFEPRSAKNRPESAINAKFSIPYTLGLAAKRKKVTLNDFTLENIPDEDIYAFAERVTYEVDPTLTKKFQTNFIHMSVETTKGHFEKYCEKAIGEPEHPLSEADFKEKFRSCMAMSAKKYSADDIEDIFAKLWNIDGCDDVSAVIDLL